MTIDDIKAIQALSDEFSCTGLIFEGNTACFSHLGFNLVIWKDGDLFSILVKWIESELLFPLSEVSKLLKVELTGPTHAIRSLGQSLHFLTNNSVEVGALISNPSFTDVYKEVTGLAPLSLDLLL